MAAQICLTRGQLLGEVAGSGSLGKAPAAPGAGRQAQPQSAKATGGSLTDERPQARPALALRQRGGVCHSWSCVSHLGGWHWVGAGGEEFCPVPILSHPGCPVTKLTSQGEKLP